MKTARTPFFIAFFLLLAAWSVAQPKSDKVSWTGRIEPTDVRAGESARLILTAKMTTGWHIYALSGPEGPTYTSFTVAENPAVAKVGKPIEPKPVVKMDPGFKVEIGFHESPAEFTIPITLAKEAKGDVEVVVSAHAQPCDARSCDIPTTYEVPIRFTVQGGEARADRLTAISEQPKSEATGSSEEPEIVDAVAKQIDDAKKKGLIAYLWLSFGFGLLALLTPCVWPMVPITVSFFSKRTGENRQGNLRGALAYCLGIMGTFTAIGLVVTLLFGAAGVQKLASNPYVNIGLALLFVVLALNLFGVFEIVVPSGVLNKAQSGTTKGGLVGPILMGLTFSLTTFTCTVPFVGTLLVAAAKGSWGYPIAGMLAFSTAFAVPFFFLALFPQFLAKLPKSGSWLTAVKAYMGFLEIAAALKFMSNADLVWLLGWLTKPVFLAIWFAIFAIGGLYLLGWLNLPHGAPSSVGPTRRVFAIATLAVAVYWLAAIGGAPMGQFSGFLPPDPYPGQTSATAKIKFTDDLDSALATAKKDRRALFVNFTGYTCTNCRTMEHDMFPRPGITRRINEFVPVELYTDGQSDQDKANADLLQSLADTAANPTYVILAPDKTVLKVFPGLALSEKEYAAFLDAGKAAAEKWFAENGERGAAERLPAAAES